MSVTFKGEEVELFERFWEEFEGELGHPLRQGLGSRTEFVRWCALEKLRELYEDKGLEF